MLKMRVIPCLDVKDGRTVKGINFVDLSAIEVFVLDTGWTEWIFGALSVVFNVILIWPWRHYFWPLLIWKGTGDHSLQARAPANGVTLN